MTEYPAPDTMRDPAGQLTIVPANKASWDDLVAIFEAGYRDDSRQQMVSAEKDARGGVP